jgi:hypothetical protein
MFIDSSTSLSSMCCVSACRHRNAGFVLRQVQISMGSLCWTQNLGIFFQHKGCMSFSMPIACQRTNSCWFLHCFVSFCVILCLFFLDFFLVSASLCFGFLAQIFAQQDSVDTQDEDRVRDSVPLTPCPSVCTMSTSSMASGVGSLPYSLSDLGDLDDPPEKRCSHKDSTKN